MREFLEFFCLCVVVLRPACGQYFLWSIFFSGSVRGMDSILFFLRLICLTIDRVSRAATKGITQ